MSYCELHKVIIGPVVNIEIYITFNTWQYTRIRVLPEFPLTFILHLVNIIVGYPIRIVIKDWIREIFLLKIMIGVDDRLDMVFVLNDV